MLCLEERWRRFVLMGAHEVEQGLKLPFENSCFDFLIPYYRKLTRHEINANFKNSR